MDAICQGPACTTTATHTDTIRLPDVPEETWHVCRAHDRQLKVNVVHSRPKKPPTPAKVLPAPWVRCGGCGRLLDEAPDVAVRTPCPDCGSIVRNMGGFHAADGIGLHDSVRVRKIPAGKGTWTLDSLGGDNYTQDLDAWGTLGRTMDRERDLYIEVIELWEGTRIESRARLSDHHD